MTRSAIIFDLDGTLTRPYLDFDAIRAEIGIPSGRVLEALEAMDPSERSRAETILERHERVASQNATVYDGAVEVVATLRGRGHPIAILTRNAREIATSVLQRHGFVIDALRAREDGAIKPSPEPVLQLCDELKAEPARSWMVGDHEIDILSGRRAGTHTVLMLGEKPVPELAEQPEHTIRALSELLTIIPQA